MSLEGINNKTLLPCKTSNIVWKSQDKFFVPLIGSSSDLEKLSSKGIQRRQRNAFEHVEIIKLINEEKFAVFLAEVNTKKFAMKLFPQNQKVDSYFQNEIRFASLNHPNIVKTVYHAHNKIVRRPEASFQASFILTEYAPHGDFFDLTDNFSSGFDEKLIRTYFHQLIEGLEYLHNQNFAHLDIKLENLLLGEDYLLKIADFDTSCSIKDSRLIGRGTKYFRAPEVITGECKNVIAADIYSAGVVLFAMKCEGFVPHTESKKYQGVDLCNLLWTNNEEFWSQHCRIQEKSPFHFNQDFRELVNGMLKEKPETRLTISQIKSSKWYSGPVYSPEELKRTMKSILQK